MTATVDIAAVVARWNDPATRPLFKGRLIDLPPPGSDEPPCYCAQGDILHTFCGWDDERLVKVWQSEADSAVAAALGISCAHAVLLRVVNDKTDGAPSIVLTHPERVLGDQATRILKFWRYLDTMTAKQCDAVRDAAWSVEWSAQGSAAMSAAMSAAGSMAVSMAGSAAWDASSVAGDAAGSAAAYATYEIQGAAKLEKFHFLPAFGFATPEALDVLP